MSDLFHDGNSTAVKGAPRKNTHSADDGELPIALPLDLVVQDRDVIAALEHYPEGDERNQYALEALKIGVLALRHVGGQASADLIQRESTRLVHDLQQLMDRHKQSVHEQLETKLKEYFDPKDGRFSDRIQRLVSQDGELSLLIKGFVDGENSLFARTLVSHVGQDSQLMKLLDPSKSEGLLATLSKTVDEQLTSQRDHLCNQFSLDNPEGALARLVKELTTNHGNLSTDLQKKIDGVVKEFSLNEENSALSQLVRNVKTAQQTITSEFSLDSDTSCLSRLKRELLTILEAHVKTNAEFQEEVKGSLRELTARREEQARSTLHGGTFQSAVFEFLHHHSVSRGDLAEFTGGHVGAIKNRKWGDVVVTLGPDTAAPGARVVFEAKEEQDYSLKTSLAEIENARKNRTAQIGVFVFSKKTAPLELRPLTRFGNDIVVLWDTDDAFSDAFLLASLELSRAMRFYSQRQRSSQAADFESIEKAMLAIEKHAANLDEIRKSAVTIRNSSDSILERVRIDREALEKQVFVLREKVADLQVAMQPPQ